MKKISLSFYAFHLLIFFAFISNAPSAHSSTNESAIEIFTQQIEIRNRFKNFINLKEAQNEEKINNAKSQITELRYDKDVLLEMANNNFTRDINQISPPAFSEGGVTFVGPGFNSITFESGDLILMRGLSTISTTIATMSDVESQFSHILMVYKNPNSGQLLAMEALLDKGVVIHPLADILNEGSPRLVLYRHKNRTLAIKAAQIAYDEGMKFIKLGKTKPYDFKLNLLNYDEVYCAEFIRMAYDLASSGQVLLPTFPSTLGGKFSHTLTSLGLHPMILPIFAPSDIDLDPQFNLAYEWIDPLATLNYRIKDQILSYLFDAIERGVVDLNLGPAIELGKNLVRGDASGSSSPMNPEKISAFTKKVDQFMAVLTIELRKVNQHVVDQHGRNMTAQELREYLLTLENNPKTKVILNSMLKASGLIKPLAP